MTIKDLFDQKIFQFYGESGDEFAFYDLDMSHNYFAFDKRNCNFFLYKNRIMLYNVVELKDLDEYIYENLSGKNYKKKEDYKNNNFILIERLWN